MSANNLTLNLGEKAASTAINHVVIAGWTGRDHVAQEKHMAELEVLGVRRPLHVPVYYRVAASRVVTAASIEVSGSDSSGEAEVVLLQSNGRLWVGVGSDHTDRKTEAYSITLSKQLCEKPVGRCWWAFDEVADHWDDLVLRSWALTGENREKYQEGSVSRMLPPGVLISQYAGSSALAEGTAMFCGTLPAIGGIRPSTRFEIQLEDPVLHRFLDHSYGVSELPIAG